ncbi:MAG TPA: hypothetical protein DD719_05980 [Desulfotomaculum sp.]|nr:hypothetical protein [Desulfotomaculum sp.]
MINLDYYCMKHGQKIGSIQGGQEIKKQKEHLNNIRKALGVLKEDGVYAMFLWLEHKDKGDVRKNGLLPLLNEENDIKELFIDKNDCFPNTFEGMCSKIQEIAGELDKLLLFKKILERTLTYALYHTKVRAGE